MIKKIFAAGLAIFMSATFLFANKGTNWTIDKGHSAITFKVAHMVVAKVYGKFSAFDVTLRTTKEDFTDAQIGVNIQVKSINTEDKKRDAHVLSPDFFDAEKYPVITLKNVSLHKKDAHQYTAEGDLTIKDVTKKIKFDVEYGGSYKNQAGKKVAGFSVKALVKRSDFNLNWGKIMEAAGAVGKEVTVEGSFEFVEQ